MIPRFHASGIDQQSRGLKTISRSPSVALDLLDVLRLDKAAIVNDVVAYSHQFGDPPRVSGNVRRSRKGYVRSFLKKRALAIILAAGLSQGVALSQSPPPQTESSLSRNPALVRDWANRLLANDRKVRATAEAALVKGAGRSLPLLRRFLASDDDDLHQQTFEIIRQIGPPAIPLLVELLRHEEVSFRGFAADALIDLAPDTESIQPALRRALRDEDSMVAADAARALGALGERASPSVAALSSRLFRTRIHTSAFTRRRPWRPSVRRRARRLRTSPEPWAIRFPASDGRRVRPSQASARPRSWLCLS